MSSVIDEVARIVASPMPRRKCLKLLGGVLSGAFLAALSAGRAKAQSCSSNCQINGQPIRCNANSPCEPCGNCCCSSTDRAVFGVCVPGVPCAGHGCCKLTEICCGGTGNQGFCCPIGKCCGGVVSGKPGQCVDC